MHAAFAPALALITRFSLAVNFALTGILFLIPGAIAFGTIGLATRSPGTLAGGITAMLASAAVALYFLGALFVSTRSDMLRLQGMVERIASGDLTARIEASDTTVRDTEAARLVASVYRMGEGLIEIVNQVRTSADTILSGAREIASGNANLSQRTEEQASALEETTASMEQLSASVRQNDESCRQARAGAAEAERVVAKASANVNDMNDTMQRIGASSRRVVDIIGVIEGIAFQTNILALNAAVEAARAGEQGRGFAVVASEVRSLAQRAAAAASEVKGLIETSTGSVEEGVRHAEAVGGTMKELLAASRGVGESIAHIATASAEQRAGVEEISRALQQMETVTQQNAALVEEASAAALSFEEESRHLVGAVGAFKVDRTEDRERAVALVKKAVEHVRRVGVARACDDFDDPRGGFVFGDFYLYVFDPKGVRLAYGGDPSKRGENAWDFRDSDGKYLVREIIHVGASRGMGWCDYKWPNPVTHAIEPKSAYIERVGEIVIGCGIYRREAAGSGRALAPRAHSPQARKARSASRVLRGASLIIE